MLVKREFEGGGTIELGTSDDDNPPDSPGWREDNNRATVWLRLDGGPWERAPHISSTIAARADLQEADTWEQAIGWLWTQRGTIGNVTVQIEVKGFPPDWPEKLYVGDIS